MSLLKLKSALKVFVEYEPKSVDEIVNFVNAYVDTSVSEYKTNIKNNCLQFGKWKGMTVKEICGSDKGKDYLQWLLKQAWFVEEKNEQLFTDLRSCGVLASLRPLSKEIAKEIAKPLLQKFVEETEKLPEPKKTRAKKTTASIPLEDRVE